MTDVYQTTRNKEKTQAELATSIKALVDNDIDMLICEVWQIQAVLLNVASLQALFLNFETNLSLKNLISLLSPIYQRYSVIIRYLGHT